MDFLDVFEDMDSLSLWDKFKEIIPHADGWVGASTACRSPARAGTTCASRAHPSGTLATCP